MDHAEVSAPAGVEKVTPAAAHTPGPWKVFNDNEFGDVLYVRLPGSKFCNNEIAVLYDPANTSRIANARLIAAAPDLLEAAELALSTAEAWIHDQLDGTSSLEAEIEKLEPVRAAIAKARTIPPGT